MWVLLTRPSTVTVTEVDHSPVSLKWVSIATPVPLALSYGRRAGLRLRQPLLPYVPSYSKLNVSGGHRGRHQVEDCDQPAFG